MRSQPGLDPEPPAARPCPGATGCRVLTTNATLTSPRGRYVEVRLALIRNDVNLQPIVYDLMLQGMSAE